MRDLFQDVDPRAHWYALVSAAPAPETGESVNVAVLFGNGRPVHLRYLERLPRLSGIAAADEINVFEAVLSAVATKISHGAELSDIALMMAPQMFLKEPRALFQELSDALVERIAQRYLTTPKAPPREINMDALIAKSTTLLDEQIARAKRKGVLVQRNVRPKTLYEGKLDRFVPFTVPKIARALRGFGRDVLIDSLVVDQDQPPATIRMAAGRIGHAFFAYDAKLKPIIRQYAGREIRTLGILQPVKATDSRDTLELRDYIRDSWSKHAIVVDANEDEVVNELRKQSDWILEAVA